MPAIAKKKAVETLAKAVKEAPPDELAEIYNELFPEDPTTEEVAEQDDSSLVAKIQSCFKRGLEIEEILDLWNVIFPEHGNVSFDEEKNKFRYADEEQTVPKAD